MRFRRTKTEVIADAAMTVRLDNLRRIIDDPSTPPVERERAHRSLSCLKGRQRSAELRRLDARKKREDEERRLSAERGDKAPMTVEQWKQLFPACVRALIGPGPSGEWLVDELEEIVRNEEFKREYERQQAANREAWRANRD